MEKQSSNLCFSTNMVWFGASWWCLVRYGEVRYGIMKYRAQCVAKDDEYDCGWYGKMRDTFKEAQNDMFEHVRISKEENGGWQSHRVTVKEFEYEQKSPVKIIIEEV